MKYTSFFSFLYVRAGQHAEAAEQQTHKTQLWLPHVGSSGWQNGFLGLKHPLITARKGLHHFGSATYGIFLEIAFVGFTLYFTFQMRKINIKTLTAVAALGWAAVSCNSGMQEQTKLAYPATEKVAQQDTYFGTTVPDPYRWLEDDTSAKTAAWVEAQNKVTFGFLEKISFRGALKSQLEKMWNYEKFSAPFKKGGYYFFYKNDGLQNQSVLYVQKSLDAQPEVLLDPNKLSADGTVALSGIAVSKDGKYLAYQIARSGSDWNEIYVMEIATRKVLEDKIEWVKFSQAVWQGNGFYYSRYDTPKKGDELKSANQYQKVYYHAIGTPQSADKLVYEDKQHAQRGFYTGVSEDERFLMIYAWESTSGNALFVKDLQNAKSNFLTIADDFTSDYSVIGTEGRTLYIVTNLNAPTYRLVKVDAAKPGKENFADVLPAKEGVLEGASLAGGKIFATYLVDAYSKAEQYDMSGKLERNIDLPAIGTAAGFSGEKTDKELFYTFTSFVYPTTIYRYDIASGKSEVFRKPSLAVNPADFETKQVFYNSHDGVRVPMFIVYKKGTNLDAKNPTYLYSYGGFNISMTPSFSVANLVWVMNGGVYAQPCIRGGGEYGKKWHEAGTKMQKKNVFLDFIAAADYLKKEKYTSTEFLAIGGGSNGGLLVGATMTMRPDVCKVAFPAVGVLDMLRYQNFTIGRAWSSDYGTAEDSKEMFDYLFSYSPVHNVKAGTNYPATMVTTADHDDRVVPAHSYKFISELQAKQTGNNPVLIRIESKAGHGAGKPTAKIIEEIADKWAFAYYNMGIEPKQ